MNLPIIQSKQAWKKEAIKRLKLSFDSLKDARSCLLEHSLLQPDYNNHMQIAGKRIMEVAKALNKKDE